MATEEIVVSKEMRTTSMIVAKHFEKDHATVLRAINNLTTRGGISKDFNRRNYGVIYFKDGMNREQQGVSMTRDGFTMLAMGFTGKEAMQWKLKYLAAFNAMEEQLVTKGTTIGMQKEFQALREGRKDVTQVIAEFVKYAQAQGSESAERYYANITKMEYKALGMLEQQQTALGNFRDTLDIIDVGYLRVAEYTAKAAIEQGMEKTMHYKEIYQFAKQKVNDYAQAVSFARLAAPRTVVAKTVK
jgi:Rha family phage regulatory protein